MPTIFINKSVIIILPPPIICWWVLNGVSRLIPNVRVWQTSYRTKLTRIRSKIWFKKIIRWSHLVGKDNLEVTPQAEKESKSYYPRLNRKTSWGWYKSYNNFNNTKYNAEKKKVQRQNWKINLWHITTILKTTITEKMNKASNKTKKFKGK